MSQRTHSKLGRLQEEVLLGRLTRRDVLKRGAALGLSAPVIAGLLAACGDDDPVATVAPETAATATSGPGDEPTATTEAAPTTAPGDPTNTPAPAPTTPPADPTATTDPGEPRGGGGLLRLLWWQAPTILNPHLAQGTKDFDASCLVYESLANIDVDGNLHASLAAEVPSLENGGVAADGMSVTWNLREGVTWHDGEPFTSADVSFTYDYNIDTDTTSTTIAAFESITSIDTPDDLTVVFNFGEPNPAWFTPFVGALGMILPKHLFEDFIGTAARDAPINLAPVGTGPYKVREFRAGDVVVYDINENYWDPGKPFFDEVEMKGGGDATSAARAALQSGEVDFSWNLQVEAQVLEQLATGGVGTLNPVPSPNVERILVNFADPWTEVDGARSEPTTQHPFLQFKEVRQALTYAIDRDTVATQLYGATGVSTTNVLAAPAAFASPNTTATFDLDQAAQMLEDAGWTGSPRSKDGVSMSILYQTSTNPVRQKNQEIVKQALESIGVPVEIKAIDAAVYFSSDAGNPDTASHFYADWEMFTNGPSSTFPISYMAAYISINPDVDIAQKSNDWAGSNVYRWVNQDYNDLYTQALTELDPDRQAELFIGMNDLVVNEVVEIPIVHRASVVAYANDLQNVEPSGWDSNIWQLKEWTR
ncbi:MAG TPA: peptide ABC transporter substrate-binding protein [Thermomicrobiales bacterium]|nr:peptide ABC transporter substrate-binding protein [Thermomicrobiales bacterium]